MAAFKDEGVGAGGKSGFCWCAQWGWGNPWAEREGASVSTGAAGEGNLGCGCSHLQAVWTLLVSGDEGQDGLFVQTPLLGKFIYIWINMSK